MTPHISQQPDGSYFCVILNSDGTGSVSFTFSDIEYARKQEIFSFVSVSILHHDVDEKDPSKMLSEEFSCRLNLASQTGREGYARSMSKVVKNKQGYDSALSVACNAVMKAIFSKPRVTRMCDAPLKKERRWMLEPFILDGTSNILFGEGGGGKTFVALRWMLSIATGIPFLGTKPLRTAPCLFLDYEDETDEGWDRVMKLCSSKSLTPDGETPDAELLQNNMNYFDPEGIPVHELVPTLKAVIAEKKIEFILIDSAVYACGGEPEKAEVVGRFFNDISKLGVTTLIIAHETKSENHDHVFGSIFWRNCVRNMWNAQSEKDPVDTRKISFGLFHRKCNQAAIHQPVPLRIFHGEGYVDIVRGEAEEWGGKSLSIPERIVAVLRSGPKQFGQIVEALQREGEVKKDVITNALTRLKSRGILAQRSGGSQEWEIA